MSKPNLVEEVVTAANSKYNKSATGTIRGVDVEVRRERYEKKGDRHAWKVTCEAGVFREYHSNLSAVESKERFEEYVETYNLTIEEDE
jgi:hypothetical protein